MCVGVEGLQAPCASLSSVCVSSLDGRWRSLNMKGVKWASGQLVDEEDVIEGGNPSFNVKQYERRSSDLMLSLH